MEKQYSANTTNAVKIDEGIEKRRALDLMDQTPVWLDEWTLCRDELIKQSEEKNI